jgi:uncharacterized protein
MFLDLYNSLKKSKELYLRIKVKPNAGITEMAGRLDDGTLKINIKSPAEKGKANKEMIEFLAMYFKINKKCISIISGKNERIKLIKISLKKL